MNNSYLHLLQISFSNLHKQKNKIKENLENLFVNEHNKEKMIDLFQCIFNIEDDDSILKQEDNSNNKIIKNFLIEYQSLINK